MRTREILSTALLTLFFLFAFIPLAYANIGDLNVCFPVFLILGLLIAALYAQGKSPFVGFDISGIYPPGMVRSTGFKPVTYSMGGYAGIRTWMGKVQGGNVVTRGAGTVAYYAIGGLAKLAPNGRAANTIKRLQSRAGAVARGGIRQGLAGQMWNKESISPQELAKRELDALSKNSKQLGALYKEAKAQNPNNSDRLRDIKSLIQQNTAEYMAVYNKSKTASVEKSVKVWVEQAGSSKIVISPGLRGMFKRLLVGGGTSQRIRGELEWHLAEGAKADQNVKSISDSLLRQGPQGPYSKLDRNAQDKLKKLKHDLEMHQASVKKLELAKDSLNVAVDKASQVASVQGMVRTAAAPFAGVAGAVKLFALDLPIEARKRLKNEWSAELSSGKTNDSFSAWEFHRATSPESRQKASSIAKDLAGKYAKFYTFYFASELPSYFIPPYIRSRIYNRKERAAAEGQRKIDEISKKVREANAWLKEYDSQKGLSTDTMAMLWRKIEAERRRRLLAKYKDYFDEHGTLLPLATAKNTAGPALSLSWGFLGLGKGSLPLFGIIGPKVLPWIWITSPWLNYRLTKGRLGGSEIERYQRAINNNKKSNLAVGLKMAQLAVGKEDKKYRELNKFIYRFNGNGKPLTDAEIKKMAGKIDSWTKDKESPNPRLEQYNLPTDLLALANRTLPNTSLLQANLISALVVIGESHEVKKSKWRKINGDIQLVNGDARNRLAIFVAGEKQRGITEALSLKKRISQKLEEAFKQVPSNAIYGEAVDLTLIANKKGENKSFAQSRQEIIWNNLTALRAGIYDAYVHAKWSDKLKDDIARNLAIKNPLKTADEINALTDKELNRLKGLSKSELGNEVAKLDRTIPAEHKKLLAIRHADGMSWSQNPLSSLYTRYKISSNEFFTGLAKASDTRPNQDQSMLSVLASRNRLFSFAKSNMYDKWNTMRDATNYYETVISPTLKDLDRAQRKENYMFNLSMATEAERDRVAKEERKKKAHMDALENDINVLQAKITSLTGIERVKLDAEKKELANLKAPHKIRQGVLSLLPTGNMLLISGLAERNIPIISRVAKRASVSLSQKVLSAHTHERIERKLKSLEAREKYGKKVLTDYHEHVLKERLNATQKMLAYLNAHSGTNWAEELMKRERSRFMENNQFRLDQLKELTTDFKTLGNELQALNKNPVANQKSIDEHKRLLSSLKRRIKRLSGDVRKDAESGIAQIGILTNIKRGTDESLIFRGQEIKKKIFTDISNGQTNLNSNSISMQRDANGELEFITNNPSDASSRKLVQVLNDYKNRYRIDTSNMNVNQGNQLLQKIEEQVKEQYTPVNIRLRTMQIGQQKLGLPFPGRKGELREKLDQLNSEQENQERRVAALEEVEGRLSPYEQRMLEGEKKELERITMERNVVESQIYLYTLELYGIIRPDEGVRFDKLRQEIDDALKNANKANDDALKNANMAKSDKAMKEYMDKAITYQWAQLLKRSSLGALSSAESEKQLKRLKENYGYLESKAKALAVEMEEKTLADDLKSLRDEKETLNLRSSITDFKIKSLLSSVAPNEAKIYAEREGPLSDSEMKKLRDRLPSEEAKNEFSELFSEKVDLQSQINGKVKEIRAIENSSDYLKEIKEAQPYDPVHARATDGLKRWLGQSFYGSRSERFADWVKGEGENKYTVWVTDKKRVGEINKYLGLANKFEKDPNPKKPSMTPQEKNYLREEMQSRDFVVGTTFKTEEEAAAAFEDELKKERDKAGRWVDRSHPGMEKLMESQGYRSWMKPLYKAGRTALIAGAIVGGITAPAVGLVLASPLIAKKGVEKVADYAQHSWELAPGSMARAMRDLEIVEYWTTRGRGPYPFSTAQAWYDYVYYGEFWKRGIRLTDDGHIYLHKDSMKLKPVGMDGIFYPLRMFKSIVEPSAVDIASRMRKTQVSMMFAGGEMELARIMLENPKVKVEVRDQVPLQSYRVIGSQAYRPYPEVAETFAKDDSLRAYMPYDESALYTHVMRYENLTIADRERRISVSAALYNEAISYASDVAYYRNIVIQSEPGVGTSPVNATVHNAMKAVLYNKLNNAVAQIDVALGSLKGSADISKIQELEANKIMIQLELNSMGATITNPATGAVKSRADILKEAHNLYGNMEYDLENKRRKLLEIGEDHDARIVGRKIEQIKAVQRAL